MIDFDDLNLKNALILAILIRTCMCNLNFVLSLVEHEKSFRTSGHLDYRFSLDKSLVLF